jgi:energy-coupling factor transport system permease protein
MPVLESALERSVELAAAMDARGFGRTDGDASSRRVTGLLTGGGLLGLCVGIYGLLDAESSPLLGLPVLLLGMAAAGAGLLLGGRRAIRTRYRPDPWGGPEWLTALCGAAAAATVLTVASSAGSGALYPAPTGVPSLPIVATLGTLVALLPAWLTPVTPRHVGNAGPAARPDVNTETRLEEVA